MRIPGGDQFGQVVARPGPLVQTTAEEMGAGLGKALEQAGGAAIDIGMDQIAKQNREKAAADQEAKRLAREQEQEAKANAKEAARVKALTATAEVRNGMRSFQTDLENGLNDGTVDKSELDSKWTEGSTQMLDDAVSRVDPAHQELVRATLLDELGNGQANVRKLAIARDKKDILTGGLSYIEQMQRFAATGGKEADQAIANVKTFWTVTGPMAGEDPAKASERVQKFAEGVRLNQATALVNTDPSAAIKALKNKDYFPELTPEARTSLINSADSALLRGQQRAALQAEASMRKLDTEWKAAQTVLEAGKSFTPEYAATLATKFKGTPYAAALNSMMADNPQNAAFVTKPMAAQDATLTELQNKMNQGGATPEMLAQYKKLEAANKATKADIKADPYMAAAERGVLVDLQPLSLNLKELPAQLAARADAARVVTQWAGQEVSLFRPAEAEKIADVLQAMPPKDQAGALAALSKTMTPGQRVAFAKQVAPKDRALELATGLSASMTTEGRYTSELLLTGQRAVKDKDIKPDNMAVTGTKAKASDYLGDALSGKARDDVLEAAGYIYYGLQANGGSADIEQAVRLAVGGPIVQHNGKKIPAPAQFNQETFSAAVQSTAKSVIGTDPVFINGAEVPATTFLSGLPNTDLQSVGAGRYIVRAGSGLVTNKNGKALVLEVK